MVSLSRASSIRQNQYVITEAIYLSIDLFASFSISLVHISSGKILFLRYQPSLQRVMPFLVRGSFFLRTDSALMNLGAKLRAELLTKEMGPHIIYMERYLWSLEIELIINIMTWLRTSGCTELGS